MNSGVATENLDDLKRLLHDEIDRRPQSHLEAIRRMLSVFEVMEASEQLDRDFDADATAGYLTPEKIDQAIRAVRSKA